MIISNRGAIMLKRNTYIAWLAGLGALLIVLLAVGCAYDYQISERMYSGGNLFSVFYEIIGKMPAYFIGGFACLVLYNTASSFQSKKSWRTFLCIVYAVAGVGVTALAFLDCFDFILGKKMYAIVASAFVGAIVFGAALLYTIKGRKQEFSRYKKWAVYYIITLAVIMIVVLILKLIWGRARYFDIAEGDAIFSPWYNLNRVGGDSMPSGHTAMACCSFMVLPLTKINPKLKDFGFCIRAFSFLFVALTMIARISGGYHYLTDVTTSAIVAAIIIFGSTILFFGKKRDNIAFKENSFWDKI